MRKVPDSMRVLQRNTNTPWNALTFERLWTQRISITLMSQVAKIIETAVQKTRVKRHHSMPMGGLAQQQQLKLATNRWPPLSINVDLFYRFTDNKDIFIPAINYYANILPQIFPAADRHGDSRASCSTVHCRPGGACGGACRPPLVEGAGS